jgi:class 3 adenylate cyclase/tetratricopeptide (TPR) repeat protein
MSENDAKQLLDDARGAAHVGDFDRARSQLRDVLAGFPAVAAVETRLRLGRLCILGGAQFFDEAEQRLGEARKLAEETGDLGNEAAAIHLLALLCHGRGQLAVADALLDESPANSNIAAPSREAGQLFHYRGLLAADRGRLVEAEKHEFVGLQHYTEVDDSAGLSEVCDSLAGLLLRRGKANSALRFCEKSLAIKRQCGDRFGEAIALGTLGRICMLQARYDDAHAAFSEDLAIAKELNDVRGIGIMLNALGNVSDLRGHFRDTESYYRQSIEADPTALNSAFSHLGIARSHLSRGRIDDAQSAANSLQTLLQEIDGHEELTAVLGGIHGALAWRRGDREQGEQLLRSAIETLNERGLSRETIPLRYELRDLYQAADDLGQAVKVMAETLEILSLCGAERSVHDVEQWLRTVDQPNLTRFALQRHLPEHLIDQILNGELTVPKPRNQELAVLFCDIRDYTQISEGMQPEEIFELINEWFSEATVAIQQHGGIIDKFIGDAVMALFGVPDEQPDAPARAVRAALEMREALAAMNRRQHALGGKVIRVGIGIHCGSAAVGFLGSHLRQSFTVIGDVVNTASRLESSTKQFSGCDILISQQVEDVQNRFGVAQTSSLGVVELKGKQELVTVFSVETLREPE